MFRINPNNKKEKPIENPIESIQNRLETIQTVMDSENDIHEKKEEKVVEITKEIIINQKSLLINPNRRIYMEERDMLTFFCNGFLKSIIIHGDLKGDCEWKLIRKDTNECISTIKTTVNTFEWTNFSNIPSTLTAMEIIGKASKESKLIAIEINF